MPSTIGYSKRVGKNVSREKLEGVERANRLLTFAEDFKQKRTRIWRNNERRYMGYLWASAEGTEDLISVNLTFSTINTIVPFITGGETNYLVEPYSGDSNSTLAKYQQVYLNRLWRSHQFNGQPTLRAAAYDSLLYGDGFVNVTWDIVTKDRRDADGKVLEGQGRDVVEFDIQHISPYDVFIDPTASDLVGARWYIIRHIMPLSALKADKRFGNTSELEATESELYAEDGRLHAMEAEASRNGAEDYIVVYDLYERDFRRLVTFVRNSDLPLRWIEDVESSLVQLKNHIIPNMPYGMSEVEQVASLQDELNKTRSQMITHRRRNIAKILYRENQLSTEALDALESADIMRGVPIKGNEPFDDLVSVLQAQPLSSDFYNVSDIIRNDIFEITGVNEYLRGSLPDQSRTATEASIIEGGSNVKIRHKLRLVEEAARQVGQLVLDIAREAYQATDFEEMSIYLTGKEAEQVLRSSGADVYDEQGVAMDAKLNPVPAIFKGRYEVFVEHGSTELRSPQFNEQRYKELFMILTQTAPVLQQFGVMVDLKRVLELWLESIGVDDINSIFQNPAANMDPQIQALLQQFGGQGQPGQEAPGETRVPGLNQQQGAPNNFGAQPPQAAPSPANSGMLEPAL